MRKSEGRPGRIWDLAAEIAAALAQPRRLAVPEGTPFPLLSLGDVLIYGAIMAQMASATGLAEKSSEGGQRIEAWAQEFTAAMRMGQTMNPQWWADLLFREIQRDPKNAQDMRMAIFQALAILEKPHLLRRAITKLVKERLPAAPEGGQRVIRADQLPDLLRRSDRWLPIAKAIAGLTGGDAAISLPEILGVLKRRYPKECAVLERSPARVEAILAHRAVASVKSLDAKARRLADALTAARAVVAAGPGPVKAGGRRGRARRCGGRRQVRRATRWRRWRGSGQSVGVPNSVPQPLATFWRSWIWTAASRFSRPSPSW